MSSTVPAARESAALASDRLGVPAVTFFILSAIAPMTVAAVVGVAYGLWLRSARPGVYQSIGLGADTAAGPSAAPGSRAEPEAASI